MLKLRKEHLDAFEAMAVGLFTARVIAHVRAVWPGECAELGDSALAEFVRHSVERAAGLGLTTEHDVVRFVDLGFILAKDFETHPLAAWTKPILLDGSLAPGAKVDRLYTGLEEELARIEQRMKPRL